MPVNGYGGCDVAEVGGGESSVDADLSFGRYWNRESEDKEHVVQAHGTPVDSIPDSTGAWTWLQVFVRAEG